MSTEYLAALPASFIFGYGCIGYAADQTFRVWTEVPRIKSEWGEDTHAAAYVKYDEVK